MGNIKELYQHLLSPGCLRVSASLTPCLHRVSSLKGGREGGREGRKRKKLLGTPKLISHWHFNFYPFDCQWGWTFIHKFKKHLYFCYYLSNSPLCIFFWNIVLFFRTLSKLKILTLFFSSCQLHLCSSNSQILVSK